MSLTNITNIATVQVTGFDSKSAESIIQVDNILPLTVSKLANKSENSTYINGEDIEYTITVTHMDGYAPVEYIVITDTIPPQITYPPKVTIVKGQDAGVDIGATRKITITVLRLPDAAGNNQIVIKIKGKIKL